MCKIKGVLIPSCYGNGVKRELSAIEEEDEDEDDDEEVVSAVRKSMEERRRLKAMYMPYDFSWTFPPATEKLFMNIIEVQDAGGIMTVTVTPDEDNERSAEDDDDFHSAASYLSDHPSSNGTIDSLIKSFTECHQLESDMKHVPEMLLKKQLVLIHELIDCEGWPFGLIRKVVQLPPLPSSPSDSWLWAKTTIRERKSANKLKRETDDIVPHQSPLPLAS